MFFDLPLWLLKTDDGHPLDKVNLQLHQAQKKGSFRPPLFLIT